MLQVKVTIASLEGTAPVKCSRDVMIVPDAALSDVAKDKFDLVVIPGGDGGAKRIAEVCSVGLEDSACYHVSPCL